MPLPKVTFWLALHLPSKKNLNDQRYRLGAVNQGFTKNVFWWILQSEFCHKITPSRFRWQDSTWIFLRLNVGKNLGTGTSRWGFFHNWATIHHIAARIFVNQQERRKKENKSQGNRQTIANVCAITCCVIDILLHHWFLFIEYAVLERCQMWKIKHHKAGNRFRS